MSSAYSTEPPTLGKVILQTTKGPLEIELWAKEAPKTCRNFLQLCMEGYYDGSPFHRLIKGFILQGGDPTGTGQGGDSCYGEPFDDEFHSRLRFTHRGLLAMANTGPNSNASQFFFTLDKTLELTKQNTIFGKVVGDTIYNLVAMGELETDENERPLNPPVIQSVEILSNPYDDIVPRENMSRLANQELERKRAEESAALAAQKAQQGSASKLKKKNLKLLSFGEEAQEEEQVQVTAKIISSHDVLTDDPRLRQEALQVDDRNSRVSATEEETSDEELEERARKRSQAPSPPPRGTIKKGRLGTPDDMSSDSVMAPLPSEVRLTSLKDQVANLKSELRTMSSKPSALSKPNKKPTVSFVEQMRQSYVSTGKVVQGKGGKRASQGKDTEVLAQLQSFTKLVQTASVKAKHSGPDKALDQIEEAECDLHFVKGCKSCKDTFGKEDEDSGDEGWMNAELRFAKDVGANVYEAKVDDYSVVDPRLAAVDKTKDIFGRGASSGKGTWRDKSLPKTQSRSSVPDAYKYAYK